MPKIREKDRNSVLNAIAGGVTPRQGIQHIQVGRKEETAAILSDLGQIKDGGGAVRIIDASYGSGKALPLDYPVLCDSGWKKICDIDTGDFVYDMNGDIQVVEACTDPETQRVFEMNLEDGRCIECSGEHLWAIVPDSQMYDNNDSGNRFEIMTTKTIKTKISHGERFRIPLCDPISFGISFEFNVAEAERIKQIGRNITEYDHSIDDILMGPTWKRKALVMGIIGSDEIIAKGALGKLSPRCSSILLDCLRSLGYSASLENGMVSWNNLDSVEITSVCRTSREKMMRCISVSGPTSTYITKDYTITHNTFFLTLAKTVALKQNFMTVSADLSPDRRLYSSSGQAQNLYREEMRSLSTPMHPDGGALEEVLDAIDEKVMGSDTDDKIFLSEIRRLPYGFDAVTVCNKWHIASNPITDVEKRDSAILKDACLRWFSGETTKESKKMLGVRSAIGDDGAWDALKLIAMMGRFAGYSGLLVELDECVNLYKINNSTSRDRNYEQILRIFNECLQGDAKYIGVIFSGTPEFVMDPRRGLFSYDALKSRLIGNEYAKTDGVDTSGPVIDLKPLSQEDLLVLLGNITNVEALGNKDDWLVNNDEMEAFLKKQYDELGADYYKTPRELLRSWVMLLRTLRDNPGMSAMEAIRGSEVVADERKSGLGSALDKMKPSNSMFDSVPDDEPDFGF